ncbi:MAG: hypothetical protein IJU84_07215, partial [Clostridia bacterium]|nr:hypothetical protein [Clostridia bacterium]
MKTKHFAIGLLAFVMAVCVGVSFTSRHTNASADEGAALWEEIISGGDFEGLGVEEGTPAVLTSEPGVGGFKGFGLLGTDMGRHGEFVNEDDNTYLKFGAGYGGFTGNDYVLQIPAVTYDRIGLGTYLLSFDIKASETVVAKTFYLRVQGGPAEFKNHYIIPYVAPDAINAEDRAEKWADLTSKMSALENGWYHYEAKYVIDGDADDLAGHTFWLMGGIAGATEDDYYGIDNLSFKRIGGVTEIFPNGDFESQIAEGEESAVLNTAKNGIQGFGASGEFVKDEKGNTYLKLGMDYEGAVVNDNGANTAIQMLGLDFTQLGSGKYVLNLDIKPCGDVGSKTHYFRTMLQPNDKDMVHFSDFPVDTWDKAVWTAGDGSVRAFLTPTTDGWYHFVQYYTITSDRDTYECTMLWLMLGLHDGTKDDYYAIDNISFSRYEEIIEGVIDDGSIEIPEEDQVEIFASLADVLGDDESYRIGNVRNGFGSYNTAGMPWGTVKHLGDDVVLQMGYEEDVTLLNEWG